MKKVLAFDVDQTLNVAKTPITDDIAELLVGCLNKFEVCPISGQKFDQFLIQIVNRLPNPTPEQLSHLHLFVAQGTQYYRYNTEKKDWEQVYNYPLTKEQVAKITVAIKLAAEELGYWEEDKLIPGDEIIENRLSQVTSRPSAKQLAPKPNTPGIQTTKNANKLWHVAKNSPQSLNTRLVAPPLSMPSLLA